MDPDQVGCAGENCHHLPDATASARGGSSDGGRACAVLRRGWELSRKAAIAGAVSTAAPVVAPPLVFLSVVGLALSVPFAVYLASLAATNRLMCALLPSSPLHSDYTYDSEDDDVEQEFIDAPEEHGEEALLFDYWSEIEDDTIMEEIDGVTSLPLSRHPGFSDLLVPALADEKDLAIEGEIAVQESGQEPFISNSSDRAEDGTSTTIEQNECSKKKTLPPGFVLTEEDNDNQRMVEAGQEPLVSDIGVDETEDGRAMEEKEYITRESPPLCGFDVSEVRVPMLCDKDPVVRGEEEGEVEMEVAVHEVGDADSSITMEFTAVHVDAAASAATESESMLSSQFAACESQELAETSNGCETEEITVMEDIVDGSRGSNTEGLQHHDVGYVCSVVSDPSVGIQDVGDVVMPSGGTPYVSTIGDRMIVESRPDGEQSIQTTDLGYMAINEGSNAVASAKCDQYTEEQFREQLDTIKKITGYRAVPSSTLDGELASLYMFVGVEPPVSTRDVSSDLMELNAKLRFLKSIIGVD